MIRAKIKLKRLVQYCVILNTILNIPNFYWSNELRIQGYIEQFKEGYTPLQIRTTDKEQSQQQ